MKKFNLYVDDLISVWRRTLVEIEAESLEEAAQKVADGEDYNILNSEILFETENMADSNEPNYEIYDETLDNCLYSECISN
jgi:uncharacterized linocin/CFP29 family protein